VELTDEREEHITETHSGTLPDCLVQLAETLDGPDQICQSERDSSALLFSKWFATIRIGRYLVTVVAKQPEPLRYWIITVYRLANSLGECDMDKNLTFHYDKVGDILYVDVCSAYAAQETEEIGDEIIARLNPDSGAIENLEILFFSTRLNSDLPLELPIQAVLKLAG
jgi:uncharacterized protein YuzE